MNRDPDFLPARGIQFARLALATAAAADVGQRIDFAAKRWGGRSTVVSMLKADVAGHEAADSTANVAGTFEQAAEFGEIVDSRGLLRDLTPVPSNVPFLAAVTDPASAWVGQSKGVPVSRAVLDRTTLQPKKIGSLLVLTQEMINSADPRVEQMVLSMMLRSARLTADAAIASPANTGDAATPAAITAAATPINSTDKIANDAQAAIEAFGGSLETACWWMRPDLAAQAGLRAGAFGAGAGLGALGGTLAGLPVYTSMGIPVSSTTSPLILLDRASVALVDEGYAVVRSLAGTVEMSDAPSGATDTPVTAGTGTKFVSLFQEGAVGLLLVRRVNWHLGDANAVVVISGANYAAA
jgi:HK97 family phage major capsid protein